MKAPTSGAGIGTERCMRVTGIDEGWLREGKLRVLVFIVFSLLLHAGLLGIKLRQPVLDAPSRLDRESRLDLRLSPEESAQALTSAPSRVTETAPPKPAAPPPGPRRAERPETPIRPATGEATQLTPIEAATSDETAATSPPIDYAAARETARQTARSPRQAKPAFEIPTPPPAEPETTLGKDIQRSVHPDCRTRYAGAGLLAIPLLINDAVRDGGCRW